jgi:DNA-binding FadR family transcriptional regulator
MIVPILVTAGTSADPAYAALEGMVGLRVPKAADVLADHLRRKILDGELGHGSKLPTERLLAEQTGLGRNTVREALRSLESEGLIVTRPGRGGGSVVTQPGPQALTRSLETFVRGTTGHVEALLEVREAIEPVCAALAASRRTDADLEELDAIEARMEASVNDTPAFLAENVRWHVAVAVASHNDLLAGFMLAIAEAVHAATDVRSLDAGTIRAATFRAHEKIVEAIRDGDPATARRRMERHVKAYGDEMRAGT